MSEGHEKKIKLTETELVRLMKLTSKTAPDFRRPSDVIISKYLLGEASESDNVAVLEAMLRSHEFRCEILKLAADIDSLTDRATESIASVPIESPSLEDFSAQYSNHKRESRFRDDLRRFVRQLRASRVFIPAIATVTVALLAVLISQVYTGRNLASRRTEWVPVTLALDSGDLRSKENRGPNRPEISGAKPKARAAVLSEMRELLVYAGSQFQLNPSNQKRPVAGGFKEYTVQLYDIKSSRTRLISVYLPPGQVSESLRAAAWLLTLPSRSLYTAELSTDTTLLFWPTPTDAYGCVVVTYHDIDGYHALRGSTIDWRR